MNNKEFKRALKEVKKKMACGGKCKKQKSNKGLWIGLAIGVVTALVGIVLWLKAKNDEDIEEYYEYFEDEVDDELEDDLYGDEEDDVEYVEIRNFSDEVNAEEEVGEDDTEE